MQDIAPQLLEAVMQAFRKNLDRNSRIKDLQEKLLSGKLTGSEADLYAVEVGQALAKAFHDEINSDTLPDGKMYYNIASRVIPPLLRACYEDVADYAEAMYQGLNERAKLGIKAQRAKYSTDREKGLIEYACGSDDYSGRQKNFEGSLVNFSQSVATDTMKENAEFQYQAGLSPVIRRSANGGCCEWCAKLAGVYPYEEVRTTGSDVYRRHRDCRCTVTYDPGTGKVQNVHTKQWKRKPLDAPLRGDNIGSRLRGKELEKEIDKDKRMRYYNSPTKNLRDIYKEDVDAGWISPLISYQIYEDCYRRIQSLIGERAANGTVIAGQSRHLMQRIAGTAIDPGVMKREHKRVHRDGVEVEDLIDTIRNGIPRPVQHRENGPSQLIVGTRCLVTINPETGVIIQCSRNTKKMRLMRRKSAY